jgi:uncharacterized alkaline shock family protein YloU
VTEPLVFRGPEGSITVTTGALTRLVAHAAQSVDGARVRRPKRAVEVTWEEGRASVSVGLSARHGVPLAALAHAVQERVAEAVAGVSALEVEHVDVEIEEVS